ncbi:MAG TPA: C4-dicarboxylate ABC transporter, partial [Thauera sp.]|nr:C4-dicarboxylate ABC transporter [Thauera sp.]
MDTSASTGNSDDLRDKFRQGLRELSPAYFGMAMATGIVSLSAHMQGWKWLATTLFWINASLYGVLWLLLLLRIAWHPGAVRTDLLD